MEKISVLGVEITNASTISILEYIRKKLESDTSKFFVVTPNPEIVVYAHHNPSFKKILNSAEIALADGVGLMWAARMMGKRLAERITGVDFIYELCKESVRKPITVGFLGGRGRVAEKTSDCLRKKFPDLKVSFAGSELPLPTNYKLPATDILFVAFGHPKQEKWIAENLPKLPVKMMMTVGGSFDYISGNVPRAPKVLRDLGLEFLFRLITQPWRLKRQLALIEFVMLIIKEKLKHV